MNVMRFAEDVDQSAQLFYQEMAARTTQVGIRQIFSTLADKKGELLRRHQAAATRGEPIDAEALNQAVNVFEQLRHRADHLPVVDDIAAYQLALLSTREMLRQYQQAAQAETHPAVRRLLARLARDEQSQVADLESLYDFANAPNHYLAWGEFSNLGDFHNFGRDNV